MACGYVVNAADAAALIEPVLNRFVDRCPPGTRLSRCGTNFADNAPEQAQRRFSAEITRLVGDGVIPPLRTSVLLPDGRILQTDQLDTDQ